MIISEEFLKKIKEFGLNSYEAKIWAALLSRGVSTAGELSDIANVPRSRSYDILESLEKKGFIVMKIGKPIKYIAVSPEEVVEPFHNAIFPNEHFAESRQSSPRSVVHRTGGTLGQIPPFHDASSCECDYDLNILDCLNGLSKARTYNFFNFDEFDIEEYEHFEQVEVSSSFHRNQCGKNTCCDMNILILFTFI